MNYRNYFIFICFFSIYQLTYGVYQKFQPGMLQCYSEALLDNQNIIVKYDIPAFKDNSVIQIVSIIYLIF